VDLVRGDLPGDNFFSLLCRIAPEAGDKILHASPAPGLIFAEEVVDFALTTGDGAGQRQFTLTALRLTATHLSVVFWDTTEKCRKEEEMREALREKALEQGKAELAADILHDIGNAVVGLGSYLTRIRRSVDDNKDQLLQDLAGLFAGQEEALAQALGAEKAKAAVRMLNSLAASNVTLHREIKNSANGQLALISHIQEILNIQRQYAAGRETGERQAVNLRAILTDSLSMLSATMEKRGIRVSSRLPEESVLIKGDRTRLMQVVMNLLKNGIEAIDVRSAEKQICADLDRRDGQLVLRISDSGCGFDAGTVGRLFDRGYTTKSSGTGLGLHNCREIIESHNGTIQLSSDGPGKGAVATIQFNL
jgi:signal transduction histidine kinase